MGLFSDNVEPLSLKSFSRFKFNSDRIHFQTELLTKVCKRSDIPEFTRQIALETIHGIPHSALKISTDGSMGDGGISGSGVHIKTPDAPFSLDNCWGYDKPKYSGSCDVEDTLHTLNGSLSILD
ncbi:hypothetical protein TNCV_3632711 [Trichonephila clavipes]|nr:hypothetical protein TNCV_3632711 [Trichonephila clavipes]